MIIKKNRSDNNYAINTNWKIYYNSTGTFSIKAAIQWKHLHVGITDQKIPNVGAARVGFGSVLGCLYCSQFEHRGFNRFIFPYFEYHCSVPIQTKPSRVLLQIETITSCSSLVWYFNQLLARHVEEAGVRTKHVDPAYVPIGNEASQDNR